MVNMSRAYRFRFKGDAKSLVARIRKEVAGYPVKFSGDEKSGGIEGMGAKAGYEISGQEITVTIHSIPFIVSWGKMEKELEKQAPQWGLTRIE